MNLLYSGSYRARARKITGLINGTSVTELCFGDILIADYCKNHKISWKGFDLQPQFVAFAQKKGFEAVCQDIREGDAIPVCDTLIMSGSLYHFFSDLESIFQLMINAADLVIISEPVKNISSGKSGIGKMALAFSRIDNTTYDKRFGRKEFIDTLEIFSQKLNFKFQIREEFSKDIIVTLHPCNPK